MLIAADLMVSVMVYTKLFFSASGKGSCLKKIITELLWHSLSLSTITIGSLLSGTFSFTIGDKLAGFLMLPKSFLIIASVWSTSMSPTTIIP